VAVLLAACGDGGNDSGKEYSGVYVPQGKGLYNRFEFQAGHKVAVTFATMAKVLDYAVTPDGIQIFGDKAHTMRKMDDGCLMLRVPVATV